MPLFFALLVLFHLKLYDFTTHDLFHCGAEGSAAVSINSQYR